MGAEKALLPRLRFPEFRDAGEWLGTRLGNIGEVRQGYGFPKHLQGKPKGLYPFYKVSDISISIEDGSHYIDNSANYIDSNELKALRARTIPKGTTIFAKIGEAIRTNRRAITTRESVIDNNTAGIKAIKDKSVDEFLFYLVSRISLIDFAGGAVPSVRKQALEEISTTIPPNIEEQQKIAACLSSLDELIAAQTRKLDALGDYKKGLMQQLFPQEGETVPRLRFPEFRDAGEWDLGMLGHKDISIFVREKMSLNELAMETYVSTENLLPDYGGVTGIFGLPTSGSFTKYREADILVSNIRPYLKKVWVSDRSGGSSNDVVVIRATSKLMSSFLAFQLKKDDFIAYVMRGAKGVKMPRGDIFLMKEYPLAFPTNEEQQKIAACLSSLDELISAQSQRLDALKTHKKGLMQQLFPTADESR